MQSLKRALGNRFPGLRLRLRQFRDRFLRFGLRGRSLKSIFTEYYTARYWTQTNPASRSGRGSSLEETAEIRRELPRLLKRHGCASLLDIPCGDFHWMATVDLAGVSYVGADIVDEVVQANAERYASPQRRFVQADLVTGPIPDADAILCRDCLIHLSLSQVQGALRTALRSKARLLLATTFVGGDSNWEITPGAWRPIDLCKPPFNLPEPVELVVEHRAYLGFGDKAVGVWRLDDLRSTHG